MDDLFLNMDCIEGMKQYPDKYFDLAIVDPVYGIEGYMLDQQGKKVGSGKGLQKKYNSALWYQPKTGEDYFKELLRVSKNQVIWGGNYFCNNLPPSQGWIVWDKCHCAERSFADGELAWTSFDRATRIFRYRWDGMIQEDMSDKEIRIHPTQKPIALYSWILSRYAKKGDIILDTHVGSASSLIACYRGGFNYVGFEIDENYYNKALERLEDEKKQVSIFDLI